MMKKIACIFNYPSHYRKLIYSIMSKELGCDFYFGDTLIGSKIQKISPKDLVNGYELLHTIFFGSKVYYISKTLKSAKNYDVILLEGEPYGISNWILLLYGRLTRKKVIVWSHGWYGKESYLKKIFKKSFFKLAYKILLYGDYARNLMISEGFLPSKLHTVYNSLDYDLQLDVRNKLKSIIFADKYFSNKYPCLIFTGRLIADKKLDEIIQMMDIAKGRGFNLNLILVGDGPARVSLEDLTKKYGLEKQVLFYGACYDEEILGKLIYQSDVCVTPGNIGLTAIHSLMFGTPVVTHNNFSTQGPEFEAIVPNVTGSFFQYGDIYDMLNSVQLCVEREQRVGREKVRQDCFNIIDSRYNPHYQLQVIKKVIE